MTPSTETSTPAPQPSAVSKMCDRIEPIVWLLAGMVIYFSLMLVGISKWSPNDGQTFQLLAGAMTTLLGALAMRIKPTDQKPPENPPEK